MTIKELIELVQPLHVTHDDFEGELRSVEIDSRKVQKDSVFIAVKGTQVDGHMFIEDAIGKGARVIITEESYYTDIEDVCILEVENSRALIGKVAQAFYGNPAGKLKITGITGTNGKTTTATLVYQVLSHCGKKASLLGTVNKRILDELFESQLTTSDPVELARDMKQMTDAGSEYLVMEVSSHALDQQRVEGVDFNVAAFTNLSHDHLDYHDTLDEYAKAKKLLFDSLPESSDAVINCADLYGSYMVSDCKATVHKLSFEDDTAHILDNDPRGLTIVVEGTTIKSPLMGRFNAYNVGEAFLICKALGLNADEIKKALAAAKGAPGRMEKIQPETDQVASLPAVIVDYAHTPDALKNILSTLRDIKTKDQNLTVIFGAGGDRDTVKRPQMARAAQAYADRIIVTSDNPRTENPDLIIADILDGFEQLDKVQSITDRREAIEQTIAEGRAEDIIVIAGKGHEDYQDVGGEKLPFDDREIAREALRFKAEGGN